MRAVVQLIQFQTEKVIVPQTREKLLRLGFYFPSWLLARRRDRFCPQSTIVEPINSVGREVNNLRHDVMML
jgi:hypothetical protein